MPPPHLMMKVAGAPEASVYLQGGELAARAIVEILSKNHIELQNLRSILDFGCGCGRVLRQWKSLHSLDIHGTDYDRALARWCSKSLKFANIANNRLTPPTGYSADRFDLVYALSVLTHLPEALQIAWMTEFRRILRPSGFLFLSLHGASYLPSLSEKERTRFLNGHVVLRHKNGAGGNLCCAFHPEVYVRTVLSQGFDVVDFVPEGVKGNASGRLACENSEGCGGDCTTSSRRTILDYALFAEPAFSARERVAQGL